MLSLYSSSQCQNFLSWRPNKPVWPSKAGFNWHVMNKSQKWHKLYDVMCIYNRTGALSGHEITQFNIQMLLAVVGDSDSLTFTLVAGGKKFSSFKGFFFFFFPTQKLTKLLKLKIGSGNLVSISCCDRRKVSWPALYITKYTLYCLEANNRASEGLSVWER